MVHAHRHTGQLSTTVLSLTGMMSAILWVPVGVSAADLTVDAARVEAIARMLPATPQGIGRPITDRAAWTALAERPGYVQLLADAAKHLADPMPEAGDELFQDYSRTGNRTRFQSVNSRRRGRLETLALAECLENKGRFVPALVEAIRSTCAERTWLLPAHDSSLANFKGERIDIDLGSVATAWSLATTAWLLGDQLPPAERDLVRARLRERILDPFKDMATGQRSPNGWLTTTNNWNAVCLAGVTGTALAQAPSAEERAFFIAAAEKYSRSFLAGFADDGYCTEGVGYWNYGYGNYLKLAETVLQATGGGVDLLADPRARRAALYGTQVEIVEGVCPAFADCSVNASPSRLFLWYISRRWELGMRAVEKDGEFQSSGSVVETALFGFPNAASRMKPAAQAWGGAGQRTWFNQAGIFIGRPGAHADCKLAVALKGGNNNEHHNHNDVGSYVVTAGQQLVLADPGAEVYTARTFSHRRYDSKVLSSFGHPVPMIAGQLQRSGKQAQGRVLRTDFTDDTDTLALDIASAYAVPALEKLERTFIYSRRGAGTFTITDEAAFSSPQTFGTALITFGKWQQLAPNRLRVEDGGQAVEVAIQATGGDIAINAEEIHEDLTAKRTPTRIGLSFAQPVAKCTLTLTITAAK